MEKKDKAQSKGKKRSQKVKNVLAMLRKQGPKSLNEDSPFEVETPSMDERPKKKARKRKRAEPSLI